MCVCVCVCVCVCGGNCFLTAKSSRQLRNLKVYVAVPESTWSNHALSSMNIMLLHHTAVQQVLFYPYTFSNIDSDIGILCEESAQALINSLPSAVVRLDLLVL